MWASQSIRRKLERGAGRHRINLARRPVDAVLDRLKLVGVTVTDDDATAWLAEQWTRNEMVLKARQVHRAAGMYGDAYLLVWPSEADDGQVDIFYDSPLTTRVF
ncbi:hypothetical protein FAIPA1_20008 [Frankia sp. AiPs1]|uniref:hypothetical protein n=1 Tax=Frankia sp. AiPa1 TaxID=573492 RepID=UPI00202B5305|nr:hypothetical protein [Frankia sp. AiPa1]MCL9759024.1 hypothetical protein [Frankia sp. AiPa1]